METDACGPRVDPGEDPAVVIAQLREAIVSRQITCQATGVLVAVHRIGPDAAWDMLTKASQDANVKVSRLAEALVKVASGSNEDGDAPAMQAVFRHLLPRGKQTGPRHPGQRSNR